MHAPQISTWDPYEIQRYEQLYCELYEKKVQAELHKLGMKLIAISDTHGSFAFHKNRFYEFLDTVEDFDLCILLGDIHPAEIPVILDCIPVEKIIGLKGNHDDFDLYSRVGIREISGELYEYQGVRFVGLDGSFRYKSEPFPSHTQYESLKIARTLPDADVLLTHDIMMTNFHGEPAHSGLIGITDYVYSRGVQWHFHGHIHQSYEKPYPNGTKEKSVYLCEYIEI